MKRPAFCGPSPAFPEYQTNSKMMPLFVCANLSIQTRQTTL